MTTRLASRACSALVGQRGVAALEFALVMPIILLILLGTYDICNVELQEMKLVDAVRAGGQYVMSFSNYTDPAFTNNVTTDVQAALPSDSDWTTNPPTVSVTPSSSPAPSCPTCQPEILVSITATRNYTGLLLFTNGTTLTATYVARIE